MTLILHPALFLEIVEVKEKVATQWWVKWVKYAWNWPTVRAPAYLHSIDLNCPLMLHKSIRLVILLVSTSVNLHSFKLNLFSGRTHKKRLKPFPQNLSPEELPVATLLTDPGVLPHLWKLNCFTGHTFPLCWIAWLTKSLLTVQCPLDTSN